MSETPENSRPADDPSPASFGAVARKLGYLTTRDALDAFALQIHEEWRGQRRPLGEICKELGLLSEEQVNTILAELNASKK